MKSPERAAQIARQGEIYKAWYLRIGYVLPFFNVFFIISLLEYKAVPFLLLSLLPAALETRAQQQAYFFAQWAFHIFRNPETPSRKRFLKTELHS